jgi:hypothetical protein
MVNLCWAREHTGRLTRINPSGIMKNKTESFNVLMAGILYYTKLT